MAAPLFHLHNSKSAKVNTRSSPPGRKKIHNTIHPIVRRYSDLNNSNVQWFLLYYHVIIDFGRHEAGSVALSVRYATIAVYYKFEHQSTIDM